MNSKIVRIVVWGLVAVAVVVVLYIRVSRVQVPRLLGEAQKQVDEGEANEMKLKTEDHQLLNGGGIPKAYLVAPAKNKAPTEDEFAKGTKEGPDVNWAKLEEAVAATDAKLAEIVKNYRAAAAKFEEGKTAVKSELVAEYFDLRSQAYQKRADAEEARRKLLAVKLDKSIQSDVERNRKFSELSIQIGKSNGEFDALEEKVQKLREDNLDEFKRAGFGPSKD